MGVTLVKTNIETTQLRPVTAELAKQYARIEGDDDDIIVNFLIDSALDAFENYTRALLYKREVTAVFTADSGDVVLPLPYAPIDEVISVNGSSDFTLQGRRVKTQASGGEIEVIYTAGITDSVVPFAIQEGILKYIASNYDDRQDLSAMNVYEMPNDSKSKWQQYRNALI